MVMSQLRSRFSPMRLSAEIRSGARLEWTTLDQVPGPLDHLGGGGWSRPKVHGIA